MSVLLGLLVAPLLYLVYRYNSTLAHEVVEIFSVFVACGIFIFAWNARRFLDNHYYLYLGIAYLFVGGIDFVHAMAFEGNVRGDEPNVLSQLWYAGRYVQSLSLLAAPLFTVRKLNERLLLSAYALVTLLLVGSILVLGIFPACYGPGGSATPFKVFSDYVVAIILFLSIVSLYAKKAYFDRDVFVLLLGSIGLSIASELACHLYRDEYVYSNLFGHYLKLVSFYLAYRAVIRTGLFRPYELLFRNLKRNEDELESRVAGRTAELKELNVRLERELSDRKRVEKERELSIELLRESEGRFRSLVEDLPAGIMIVQEGRIVFRNPAQERLFGPIPEGLEFRRLGRVHPDDLPELERLSEAMASRQPLRPGMDLRFLLDGDDERGEGETRCVHCQAGPIDYRGGSATLVNMVDISKVKELERIVAIREKLATIGQLAAGIAHEIRNPLAGIDVNVSTIGYLCEQAEGIDPDTKEQIDITIAQARSAARKIASVIRKVMDFSKSAPPRFDVINVNDAVEDAIVFASVSMRKQNVTLQKALAAELPSCRADRQLLERVLINLITNALQAMEPSDRGGKLEVGTSVEDDRIVIRIADSGPGVPIRVRSKIFDPFYTTRKDGHGIGLSFSHRVISDHGGIMRVGSSRWGGAEFRIELPLAPIDVAA